MMNKYLMDLLLNFMTLKNIRIQLTISDLHVLMEKRAQNELVIWSVERTGSEPGATRRFFKSLVFFINNDITHISMEDVLNKNLEILLQEDGWEKGTLVPRSNRDIAAVLCPDVDELSYVMTRDKFFAKYGGE